MSAVGCGGCLLGGRGWRGFLLQLLSGVGSSQRLQLVRVWYAASME